MFFGRKQELKELTYLLKKNSASLIVLKGRRRIGKSRLLQEFGQKITTVYTFSGLAPEPKITAQSQRNEFAQQLTRQLNVPMPKKDDWGDLFYFLSLHAQEKRMLIILDEISWMGSKDAEFLVKLKNAWDLYFSKNSKLVLALCGSVSTWIEKNILSSTGFLGRISLQMTLEELPLKDCVKFWGTQGDSISAYEKLKVLAVTGGVPRYLEQIKPELSAEENIRLLCFSRNGILLDEFERIFSDLFSTRSALYKKIVEVLAKGACDLNEIAVKLKISRGGDLSAHLDELVKSGFVTRDYTWIINSGTISKLSHFRLKDNYSRFYLKYIQPNIKKIETNFEGFSLSALPAWNTIMGLQVENLILANKHLIKKAIGLNDMEILCDNPFFQRKSLRQEGCQIDYLIQTKYNSLYVCEIKYSKNPVSSKVIADVQEKISRLKKPKNYSCRAVLIHINGVQDEVEDSQYFSHILDFSEFLR